MFRLSLILAGVFPLLTEASLPASYRTLILEPQASAEVREATQDLADLMEAQFGTRPRVRRATLWDRARGIRIGPNPEHPLFDTDPLTDEIIVEHKADGLHINGSDNPTTIRAIARFAHECLGWRQYQPGPLGRELLNEPPAVFAEEPDHVILHETAAFLSRNPTMQGALDAKKWSAWHGLRERLRYNHSLHRVIPSALFDTYPEWFAKDANGAPVRPPYYPQAHGHNDHPDLRVQSLRDAVRDSALLSLKLALPEAFNPQVSTIEGVQTHIVRRTPGLVSLSLSLGDAYAFGEFPDSYVYRPKDYFRRWPDWSNHVFAYSNAVAESIEAGWESTPWMQPDGRPLLLIGVLAYLTWEAVPDFPINERIVPYLTYDRSQWHDPDGKADDLQTISAWNQTEAPFLATWDYLFGYGFLIPRSLSTVVAESIPELHQRGVRAYFSQVCPVWPYDGHTNWLTAELLWNPNQDADALLNEYFDEFYGPAAPQIRSFMDSAEHLWMNQEGAAWWLRFWKDPWQAALWSRETLAAQSRLLVTARDALRAVPNTPPRFAQRLHELEMAFSLTRAFLQYQWAAWEFQLTEFDSLTSEEIAKTAKQAESLLQKRRHLIDTRDAVITDVPGTSFMSDLSWVFRYDAMGGSLAALALRAKELKTDALQVHALLSDWAKLAGTPHRDWTITRAKPALHDRTFAKFADNRIWYREFLDAEGLLIQKDPLLPDTIQVMNARRGHIYQLFKALPDGLYSGSIDISSTQTPAGDISLILDFYDKDMRLLGTSIRARIAPPNGDSSFRELRTIGQAPPNTAYGRLKIRFYELEPSRPVWLTHPNVLHLNP
jgi:hypothetical protein